MATKTSAGSGLWSVAGTWDSGVPVDDDIVVIAAGHTVEFDVDTSGFANGIQGITLTGNLKLTRTAGTYYLKMKAAKYIVGAGNLDCGTVASPIPAGTFHTITGGAAWRIENAMVSVRDSITNDYVKTTEVEPNAETVLAIDTDISSDDWKAGDIVTVIDTGVATDYTIASKTSSTLTLTGGITSELPAGSRVYIKTRNLNFLAPTASTFTLYNCDGSTIQGGYWTSTYRMINISDYITINGGYFVGSYIFYNSGYYTINNGCFLCSYLDAGASGFMINDIFSNGRGASVSWGNVNGGEFINANNTYYRSRIDAKNVIFRNTATAAFEASVFNAFNCLFVGTDNNNYGTLSERAYSESINHNQVEGAYKAWTKGGVTTSQASVLPAGYSSGFLTVLENASYRGYLQEEITVRPGVTLSVEVHLRKSASMTYLPRACIFNKGDKDPLSGGGVIDSFTMTDSTDTYESDTLTFTNSGSVNEFIIFRIQGMNATGNLYSAYTIDTGGSGGGAVSIQPVFGRVGL